jgi:hypothetical protein
MKPVRRRFPEGPEQVKRIDGIGEPECRVPREHDFLEGAIVDRAQGE